MPEHPIFELGEVAELVGGGTPSKAQSNFWNGNIPWASVRDLKTRFLSSTEFSISPEAIRSSATNLIPKGQVVIATRVGLGKASQPAIDVAINQDLRALVVKDKSKLSPDYLYYWYLSVADQVIQAGTGATVQGVKVPFIAKLSVPVPGIDAQVEKVARLDKTFLSIESSIQHLHAREEFLNLLIDKLIKGTIEKLGAVKYENLKSIAQTITKGTTPTSLGFSFEETGVNFIKVESISDDSQLLSQKFAKISNETHSALKRSQLMPNDVLLTIAGALGRSSLVTSDILPANTNQAVALIRLDAESRIIPTYLLALFRSGYFDEVFKKVGAGAAQQNLSLAQIGALEIPMIDFESQVVFIESVNKALKIKSTFSKNKEKEVALYLELQGKILNQEIWGSSDDE